MVKARETLVQLKSIIEEGIFEYDEEKSSLYEIISLLKQYMDTISYERANILDNISKKVGYIVKIHIKNNLIILSINTIKDVKFVITDDDLSVLENKSDILKPLELFGKEILDYYNLVSPIAKLNDCKFDTEKAEIYLKTNNELNINIKIKNTDLSFRINCGDNSFDIDYNSLKVIEFLKENSNSLLKCIFIDKNKLLDFIRIEDRLRTNKVLEEKTNIKKKSIFDVFKRK